jgi:hypothetical protein
MRDSIIDAIFETDLAKGKLASTAMGEDARAERLIRLIGEFGLTGFTRCTQTGASLWRRTPR